MKQNKYCYLFPKLTVFNVNFFTWLPNFHLFRQSQNFVDVRNIVSPPWFNEHCWSLLSSIIIITASLSVINGFPSNGHSHLRSALIHQSQFSRNQKGQKTTKVLNNRIQTLYLMNIKYFFRYFFFQCMLSNYVCQTFYVPRYTMNNLLFIFSFQPIIWHNFLG